jgi:hypothetical protein
MAAGGVILLALGALLRHASWAANGQKAATDARAPDAGPEPHGGS